MTAYPEVPTESSSDGAEARPIASQEFWTGSETGQWALGLKRTSSYPRRWESGLFYPVRPVAPSLQFKRLREATHDVCSF
jgi:hypothetical protein